MVAVKPPILTAATITVRQAGELYLQEARVERSPNSYRTFDYHFRFLCNYWGSDRLLNSITRLEVQQWLNSLRPHCKPATLRHKLSALSGFYRVATEYTGEILEPPTRYIRKPPVNNIRERILLDNEEDKLREFLGFERFSIIEFALMTGLRRVEQFRLKPDDVRLYYADAEDGSQPVLLGMAHIITSKTGRGRQVPLNPTAAGIAKYWADLGKPYLFPSYRSDRYEAGKAWSAKLRDALAKLDIKGLRWHDLRHTFATRALQGGARPEQIGQMLGHTQSCMTRRYLHWAADWLWPAAMATFNRPINRDARSANPVAKWCPDGNRPPSPVLKGPGQPKRRANG